ncbi:hypothetical protein [Streptomyces sp. SHP 1-2]|uniref:hypothetical protein n=1 Tax=Streptomyces sp. SHP 1-2 TaxID=2769489 RepID=UPI0022374327|nr:hypothetical protein [Streptomyces sp. SHP 1-2]MCW5254640.1 hypothetical protein [Streptomyces sp. SHP 1-2]
MDPISASVLVAAATGAGGEAGRRLWEALSGLVRRTPGDDPARSPVPAPGEDELDALARSPEDEERARLLGEALRRRAAQDPGFRARLVHWEQRAQVLNTGSGDVRNVIGGGTQQGPVVQGRDFSGITFNGPDGR